MERERDYLADPTYLDNHPAVQPKMRAILADWLIEVCEECVLHRETYYMALNFVDRYLSVKKNVQKKNLQGLGVTALFMASKLQEIYPPPIHQFVDITDRACSESFIIAMELEMLVMSFMGNYFDVTDNFVTECFTMETCTSHCHSLA